MKLIVGLGNPGREYAKTRHNLGFMVVGELARRAGSPSWRTRFKAELADATIAGQRVILLEPQTYMNLSGHAVREAVNWYKIRRHDVLVVLDDLDIPFGALRMRESGGAGGHNGLKSIVEQLGGADVARLRLGIGRGPGAATAQVLSRFSADEERALPPVIAAAADCCEAWLAEGAIAAMNRCNRKPEAAPSTAP
ncbi:MAG: aminoacyl-tRNA hydrolase [Thermomicrobiales bacterium]|nr:aminoacyl-tRNA hydrolase [Thermomicrobiales bacterium]